MTYKLSSCPVTIFYEGHGDKSPAQTITGLLKYLQKNKVNVLALEESHDISRTETKQTLIKIKDYYATPLKSKLSFEGSYLEQKRVSNNPDLTKNEFKNLLVNIQESYQTTIDLLDKSEKMEMRYMGMDLSHKYRAQKEAELDVVQLSNFRDKYFVKKISQDCKKHGEGIVVLVGLNHLDIENQLKKLGMPVISIYIAGRKPEYAHDSATSITDSDVRIRQHDESFKTEHPHNIHVIDLYEHPEIDPIKATKSLLNDFFEVEVLGLNTDEF